MKLKKILSLVILSITALALFSCNNDASKNENEKHVHSYTETIVEPTCDSQGYTIHTCSCGEVIIDNYTPKLEHEGDFVCKYCHKDLKGQDFYKNMLYSLKNGFCLDVSKICYEHLKLFTKEDITVSAKAEVFFDYNSNLVINVITKTTKIANSKKTEVTTTYTSTSGAIPKITYKSVDGKNNEPIAVKQADFDDKFISNISEACEIVVGYINTFYTFFPIFYKLLPLEIFEDLFDLDSTDTGYIMRFDQNALSNLDKYVRPIFKDTCANIFNKIILNFVGKEAYKQIFNNDAALFYSDIDNLTALLRSISVGELLALVDNYIAEALPLASNIFDILYKNNNTSFKNITGVLNIINLCFGLELKLDEDMYKEIKDLDIISAVANRFGIKDSDKLIEIIHNVLFNESEGYMGKAPIDVLASLFYDLTYGVLEDSYRESIISFVYFIKSYYDGLTGSDFYFILDEKGKIEEAIWDLSKINYTNENNLTISDCENVILEFGKKKDINTDSNIVIYEMYYHAKKGILEDFYDYVSDTYFNKEEVTYSFDGNNVYLYCNEETYELYDYQVSYNNEVYIILYRFISLDKTKEIKVYAYYDRNLDLICYKNN